METKPIVPTQEHIDRLLENPREYLLFDEIYGDGASLKYLPEVPTTKEEKKEKDTVEGFIPNVAVGIKEAGRETLETLQGLSNTLNEKLRAGSIRIGKDGISYVSQTQLEKEKEEGIDPFKEERKEGGVDITEPFQKAADVLPESGAPEGIVGGLSRGVSQFVTGFVAGGYVLKTLGWAKKAKDGYNITRSFVQGGIADFAVFDEHEARLADFIIDSVPAADNAFLQFMSADENDTFVEGKLKNVLEGAMLGGVAELLFKSIRMMRGTRKRLDAGDKEGAKKFAEKEAKDIENTKQKANDEIDEVAEQAKGKRGLPDETKPKKKFNVKKDLKGTDFFKDVQATIKKIRQGEADIDDLEEITTSLRFIDDVDDAATVIRVISNEINKLTKEFDETLNHDQVWRQVDNMLDDPTEALVKAQEYAKISDKAPAIQLAMRTVFNGLYKRLQHEIDLFELGKISQKELDNTFEIVSTLWRLDKQIGKNTGRALEIRKVIAGSETKASKKIKHLLEEAELRPEEGKLELYKKIKKVKDRKGFISVMKAVQEKLGINGINKFWINALLSNPKTHMINMTSNTLMALIRPVEHYIGGVLTRDKSARIEAIHTAAGIIKYFTESLTMAREAFRKSDSLLDKKNFKVDLAKGAFKKGASRIEKGVELPTRFLSTEDEFFKQLNYRAAVYGQSVAEGLRKGLSKRRIHRTADGRKYSDLDLFVEKRFDEAFMPNKEAAPKFKKALEYAQENTFTKALGQHTLGKTVQSAVNTVPILRQIMPFVRTPVNIARAVWDRSPLGIFRKQFRKELFSPDKSIRAQAVGKQVMGGALFTTAIILAWNEVITGGVPRDKNLRRQKFDTGWRPYSFKLGDTYHSYERLDPFGMFFGLIADYATIANEITEDERAELGEANMLALVQHMDFDDWAELGAGGIIATSKNIASKTYLKSLTDFTTALASGDPREWKRYGLTKTGSFVPNIIKGITNDPLYREVRNLTDTLKTRTGFYGDVDPSFNALGEARTKGQSFWDSVLFPITQSEEVDDSILKEFDRLGQSFSPIDELIGNNKNIDLTEFKKDGKNAFVRFNEILGQNGKLRKELEELINSDRYQNRLTDNPIDEDLNYSGSRAAAIKRILNKYKKKAKATLLREGFITESNLDLHTSVINDTRNKFRASRGLELLPTN